MTDRDIVVEFLKLCSLNIETCGSMVVSQDNDVEEGKVTVTGYDEVDFYFDFNDDGSLDIGHIQSHVITGFSNLKEIRGRIEDLTQGESL